MSTRRYAVRAVRLKAGVADEIARRYGAKTYAQRAAFYGVHETTYLRASREENWAGVGSEFIAAALASPAARTEPNFCFDTIFQVVDR